MIIIKSVDEVERMRIAGNIVSEILQEVKKAVQVGTTTLELERIAEDEIKKRGAHPTFKGYKRFNHDTPFPSCICVSVNEEVVHGIPAKRKLHKGDIVSIDVGVKIEGFCSDAAITVPVENVPESVQELLQTTEESLTQGITQSYAGNRLQDISYAIQKYVEDKGFSVVRDFVGHGIGRSPHEDPQVPNYGKPGCGKRLEVGMVLAIEPMVTMGSYEVDILDNGWTAITVDRSWAAHFEHTVAITRNGPEILSAIR